MAVKITLKYPHELADWLRRGLQISLLPLHLMRSLWERYLDTTAGIRSGNLYAVPSALLSEKPMERAFEIRSLSDPRLLSVIRAATAQIALVAGFEPKQIEQIKLAVDEVCTNIIRHTYNADPHQEMILAFTLFEKSLEIDIQDFGEKVDPRVLQKPRPPRCKPGGLGLSLIESVIDKIEFGLPTAVGNKYRLIKYKGKKEA